MHNFEDNELHRIEEDYIELFKRLGLPIIRLKDSDGTYTFTWLHRVWDYTVFKAPDERDQNYHYDWECMIKLYKDETFRIIATAIDLLFGNNYEAYSKQALPSLFDKLGISNQISKIL